MSLKFKLRRKLYIELFLNNHNIWLKWKLRKLLKLQTKGKKFARTKLETTN